MTSARVSAAINRHPWAILALRRNASCCKDSSPYVENPLLSGQLVHACSSRVLFPAPGSPPINTTDPRQNHHQGHGPTRQSLILCAGFATPQLSEFLYFCRRSGETRHCGPSSLGNRANIYLAQAIPRTTGMTLALPLRMPHHTLANVGGFNFAFCH